MPPPDVSSMCPNGVTDACLPVGATSPCGDLGDGAAHTITFAGLRTGLPSSCEGTMTGAGPDGAVPLTVTRTSDLVLTVNPIAGSTGVITLYRPNNCGVTMQELGCANTSGSGNTIRATSLPPGTYWVQVSTNSGASAVVQAMLTTPGARPAGDLCPGVAVRPDGGPTTLSTMGFSGNGDYGTSCGGGTTGNGDAVFTFTTTAARDVTVDVSGTGGAGVSIELTRTCGDRATAIPVCTNGNPARQTFRNLPAGTYFVTAAYGNAPRNLVASVTTAAPTMPAAADACPGVALTPGVSSTVSVGTLTPGSATFSCLMGNAGDGVFSFTSPPAGSDVLVNVTSSNGGVGLQLQRPCGGAAVGGCVGSFGSVWQRYSGLTPATAHALVVASNSGTANLSVNYRVIPTPTTTAVMGNTMCGSAATIPQDGGLFRGSTSASGIRTSNMSTGSLNPGCAPTQCLGAKTVFYRMVLTERRRVVVTMNPVMSNFDTLLFIRSGNTCPGNPIMNACNDDRIGTNAQVDVILDPGTYWVMASGCGFMAEGEYTLDVASFVPG